MTRNPSNDPTEPDREDADFEEQQDMLDQEEATGEGMPVEEMADQAEADDPQTLEAFASLRQERDELHDRLLRTAADYQNFVKRSQSNIQSAREQVTMQMARALIPVLDHFDQALAVAKDDDPLAQGVKMVQSELVKVMEQFGVTRIDANPGEEFDPRRHEALMRQAADGIASNHVVTQLQPGYALGDKTLRPAKVAVAE